MPSPFTSNLLSMTIRTQLGLACLALPIVALSAQAQNFDISAGDLDSVLNQFALQAGIEYSIDASLSQGQYSLGLQGDYQPDDAFRILLADAGLSAQKQVDGSYLVDGGDEWSLDAIQVGTSLDGGISRDEAGKPMSTIETLRLNTVARKNLSASKGRTLRTSSKGWPTCTVAMRVMAVVLTRTFAAFRGRDASL